MRIYLALLQSFSLIRHYFSPATEAPLFASNNMSINGGTFIFVFLGLARQVFLKYLT